MNILDLEMTENDADAKTIGEYLQMLLQMVWDQGEGFNGKRPFGNSGWHGELELALIQHGLVDGELDEDGYIDRVDSSSAHALISQAIKDAFK